jgi:hypothetical protein
MTEQLFTIDGAAQATGKSTDQIRRAIRSKKLEASIDPTTRGYRITLTALLDAGFMLKATPPANTTPAPSFATRDLEAKIETLEAVIRELRDRVASQERQIEQLTASLPALMAGSLGGGRWWRTKAKR